MSLHLIVVVASTLVIGELRPTKEATTETTSEAKLLSIGFAYDPYQGNYDGIVGKASDVWNFVDIGTTAIDYTRYADASSSPIRIRVTRHDGEWAVNTHRGVFRGYIYHNCQCVDLETTLLDVPQGRYRAIVYAHGDRPEQNAKIEIVVGEREIGSKATANDGTWEFQSEKFREGVHYVSFEIDVRKGENVRIISHRDGSDYSMFNAIQLLAIDSKQQVQQDVNSLKRR